jgi:hypothetical protein
MSGWKKLAAASAASGGVDVDEVFSTYLYRGNGSGLTIANDINLTDEGGMVWVKSRSQSDNHIIADTERGASKYLKANSTSAVTTSTDFIQSFNSNGFSTGNSTSQNGETFSSWTYRRAPKFFAIATYTGTGPSTVRTISHDLGCDVGWFVVKRLDATEGWYVWHRGFGDNGYMTLNTSNSKSSYTGLWNNTAPTSTHFTVTDDLNATGATFVVYLWAHNDGDGEFGPDGDQDIIKCGSYTGTGHPSSVAAQQTIELGFEPQLFLTKRTNSGSSWQLVDNMRTMADEYRRLFPDAVSAEDYEGDGMIPTPTGIRFTGGQAQHNASGGTYIYMAIRRGSLFPPESGTDVYSAGVVQNNTGRTLTNPLGHSSDWAFTRGSGEEHWIVQSRLTGKGDLKFDLTNSEVSNKGYGFANNTNYEADATAAIGAYGWNFRRAPSFLDIVCYNGSGTGGYGTINHNLGVVPELAFFKNRSSNATPRGNWYVYHKDLTNSGGYLYLNGASAEATDYSGWATGTFAPTDTTFTVVKNTLHYTNEKYIAYFFATVAGISKVGMFTGNGSSINVDCGFSSGARFVWVKALNTTGNYFLFDTARGIVSGDDPALILNANYPEDTSRDLIDPLSSGFTINYNSDWGNQLNGNGYKYIFYAVA